MKLGSKLKEEKEKEKHAEAAFEVQAITFDDSLIAVVVVTN